MWLLKADTRVPFVRHFFVLGQRRTIAVDFEQRLRAWQEQSAKLKAGEFTKEDYDRWRYYYPDCVDTRITATVPLEEPVKDKRGRKPKTTKAE